MVYKLFNKFVDEDLFLCEMLVDMVVVVLVVGCKVMILVSNKVEGLFLLLCIKLVEVIVVCLFVNVM